MKWERELGDALRELARSADEVPENPAAEQRLLEAFDAGVALAPGAAAPGRRGAGLRAGGSAWTLAAAASLVLATGGWWIVANWQQGAPTAAAPGGADSGGVSSRRTEVTPETAARPPSAAPAPEITPGVVSAARPARTRLVRPAAGAAQAASVEADNANDADEFIALPAADRLPSFESGMIVRVELPVSSLPAYGLPIMPDTPRTPVTADVIVGQDGQPRAIRLVRFQTAPRRR